MSVEGLEMLGKHMAYYDFAPDSVLLLGNVLYYAKKAEVEVAELEAENAKLRNSLKDLMMGTYAELCADMGEPQCRECAMRCGDESCVIADTMELLGIDMYGEPLGIEVE